MKEVLRVTLENGNTEYVETRPDGKGNLDLSIRTVASDRKVIMITAKLSSDNLDKLISNLISLKSRMINEGR
jgi:hypothetical protein